MADADLDARAAEAERSVSTLFAGRLLGIPGTHLARVEHPLRGRADAHWNYWWQAHYLDCVVDAGRRALRLGDVAGAAERARRGDRLLATIRLRNIGRFPNAFYDDMAWLVLASGRLAVLQAELGRARPGRRLRTSERVLTARLRSAVTDDLGGGAFWNTTRDFKNVPASGPVALHLARTGDVTAARSLVEWMYARLLDPDSGLFLDGVRLVGGEEVVVRDVYTYNQGTVLGALITLGDAREPDPRGGSCRRSPARSHRRRPGGPRHPWRARRRPVHRHPRPVPRSRRDGPGGRPRHRRGGPAAGDRDGGGVLGRARSSAAPPGSPSTRSSRRPARAVSSCPPSCRRG